MQFSVDQSRVFSTCINFPEQSDAILVRDNRNSFNLVSKSQASSSRRVMEEFRINKNCIVSSSDSEVVVDHASDLSSANEIDTLSGLSVPD